jgi:hypothetical protein
MVATGSARRAKERPALGWGAGLDGQSRGTRLRGCRPTPATLAKQDGSRRQSRRDDRHCDDAPIRPCWRCKRWQPLEPASANGPYFPSRSLTGWGIFTGEKSIGNEAPVLVKVDAAQIETLIRSQAEKLFVHHASVDKDATAIGRESSPRLPTDPRIASPRAKKFQVALLTPFIHVRGYAVPEDEPPRASKRTTRKCDRAPDLDRSD